MFVVNILSFRRNISDFLILEWHHFFPFIIILILFFNYSLYSVLLLFYFSGVCLLISL